MLWAIATTMLAEVLIVSHIAQHKLAGLELLVVRPAALLLYIVGFIMGVEAVRAPAVNPFARTALLLNFLPLFFILCTLVFALFKSAQHSL